MGLAEFARRLFRRSGPLPAAGPNAASSGDETIPWWQKDLADFGFPYRVVASEQAEAALEADRQVGLQEGFCPVIIVPGLRNLRRVSARARIRKARKVDAFDAAFGRAFLAREFAQLREALARDEECDPEVFDKLQPVAPQTLMSGLFLLRQYNPATRSMDPLPEVAIMRVPTTDSVTIPVYLDWGSWNAVPSPAEIVAVCRYWGEAYGARLTVIRSDALEFTVARKPATHAAAVALLKEHCCFSRDIWENDRGDLEQSAAQLRVSDTWFFWWD
jgi:hypothetical protein